MPVQPFALGVIVTVALPVIVVKEGIDNTPVTFANPTDAPPVISNTTPVGVPVNAIAEVITALQ